MKKIDARTLSRDTLTRKRIEIIRLYRDNVPIMQIAQRCGVSWPTVNVAITRYKVGGEAALQPAVRGRKLGDERALTQEQEAEIRQLIRRQRPWFYRLRNSWWDRETIAALIEQRFGVRLVEKTVSNYLERWGLSLTKAGRRSYDRCSRRTKEWLENNWQELRQRAVNDNAEIYWLVRKSIPNIDLWFPQEECKVLPDQLDFYAKAKRRLSLISAVNRKGKVRWIVAGGSITPERQLAMVKGLVKDTKRKVIFVIRCNSSQFDSKTLRHEAPFLMKRAGKKHCMKTIQIFP